MSSISSTDVNHQDAVIADKKSSKKPKCNKCSTIKTVGSAFVVIATLAVTIPYATVGNPPIVMTMAFALALGFMPAVLYNNVALIAKKIGK
ncbi:MAG: hypothetical protein COB46_06940 [Rhodospirillaceae bacterium]|nr:MAG: hypothetical protein COB46_06940 [Rhodospirillaceae bacterium]